MSTASTSSSTSATRSKDAALDCVRDALETEVLTQKQDEAYTAAVDAWVAEADAKIYKDRLN